MASWRGRPVRIVVSVIAALLVLALVGTAALANWVIRGPLAKVSGTVTMTALDADARVIRDERGIPHIYAASALDLFRAQGYVSAQDRFFEMDYRRHVASGRLSELVGYNEEAIAADKVIRTMGWRRVAEQELPLLTPQVRSYLQAYADGVNAYLHQRPPSRIAMEYPVLGIQVRVSAPEPWGPVDSLVWLKAMAWDLRSNYDEELERALYLQALDGDAARVAELFPAYDARAHTPTYPQWGQAGAASPGGGARQAYSAGAAAGALGRAKRALDAVPALMAAGEGTGSNSWVVAGKHTASGQSLLANDPHLGISSPGIWYQASLHCTAITEQCPFDVSGFTLAGVPGVVIGHNASFAWGLTNLGADVTDFFLEQVGSGTYLREGERAPLEIREEVIKVNGGDDVPLTIRATGHGPILSDAIPGLAGWTTANPAEKPAWPAGYGVALAWTALQPGRTAEALFALNTATDGAQAEAAAALFDVPAQNIVWATRDHIGSVVPGKIPIRRAVPGDPAARAGTWPRLGWDARYDWDGYVERDALPRVQDPAEGFIVAANQAPIRPGAQPYLGADWDYGYRSQRIREQLQDAIAAGRTLDGAAMSQLQLDDANPYADVLIPALSKITNLPRFTQEAAALLKNWDRSQDADSPAAMYFAAVWKNLLALTFDDELPAEARADGSSRWLAVVARLLQHPGSKWWDRRDTPAVTESRDEILHLALVRARAELTRKIGKDTSAWTWGKLHRFAPVHPVLGGDAAPGFVRALVNPGPVPISGGPSMVNATSWLAGTETSCPPEGSAADPDGECQAKATALDKAAYDVTAAPSMRMVVDFADLDRSTWVNSTGNSGQPGSRHYTDQIAAYSEGRTYPWPFSGQAVADAGKDELLLRP